MSYLINANHKVVVVNHPGLVEKILELPGSKKLSENPKFANFTITPHNISNSQGLRELGIDVPSPIGYYYDWPKVDGRHNASAHQKEIAAFATLFKRSYDLSEVGTRKTHSHLFASDYLQQTGDIRKVLVVAPLSTLERVWADAIFFTLRHRSAAVLHGTAPKRRKLFAEEHDYYIINHDGLNIITDRRHDKSGRLISAKLLRDDIDLVIVDEGAEFRNWGTTKASVLKHLITEDMWVAWLTGTPTPNAPTDAWSQSKIVTPERVPKYFSAYRDRTMTQKTQYIWVPRPSANTIVHNTLQPSIRYERNQVIPVHEAVYSERLCTLTKEQKTHYDNLKKDLVTRMETGEVITAVNQGVLRSKLLQAACGVIYDKDKNIVVLDAKPRHDIVKEVIRQCGQKVIVFVPFRHALVHLYKAVKKEFTCEMVHGGVSKTQRDKIFQQFQSDHNPRAILADARCMSHGLTLTEASTILWYAPPISNNIYVQANGRITRDGQVNIPNIIHITGTPAESKAYQRIISNGRMQDLLLEMVTSSGIGRLDFSSMA